MEIEEIGVGSRLRMRGLKNRGLMEVSEDPIVLVISSLLLARAYATSGTGSG